MTSEETSPGPEIEPEAIFNPTVAEWFRRTLGSPTQIQTLAWPRIAAGEHVLLSAPTGSGKTLTAFLWSLNQLASGAWPVGETSVLYVSPLKALNNDIRANLLEPLAGIRNRQIEAGERPPEIRVQTRSGDTPQSERRRMVTRPPEILITTPESLNLILSSPRAREILRTVRTVILDEVHAIVGDKRGTHLIAAVERVVRLAGEFQRIALSATVTPMELVARFVGGKRRVGEGFETRRVTCLEAARAKSLELSVRFPTTASTADVADADDRPGAAFSPAAPDGIWDSLIEELNAIIRRNQSTLIFVTTRRHAEKITELLNGGLDSPIAYAHHGSLSREIRSFVETSLKAGRLRAIVATNSLELGIDIGALDQVVMVKTPMSVASTLQRIGRAGHQVGATSRGVLFPLYGRDAVDAAVVARAALEQNIEQAAPVVAPLDVLAQQLVSMTAVETWDLDDLYEDVRCSWPYHDLRRNHFDLVVEMLAGRYAGTRIRDLKPRVTVDRIANTISARDGAVTVLYQSGGTIPDRGYFGLRLAGDGGRIGELDEEFVWERKVGDTFYLGSQLWTISRIGDRDVEVTPGSPGAHIVPFWKAEARGRGSHYSALTLEFLEACEIAIRTDQLDELLADRAELDDSAREPIAHTLSEQRAATRTDLPHRHHVVVEECLRAGNRPATRETDAREIVVHCPWGMGVNQALGMVLAGRFEQEHGEQIEVFADDACIAILLPSEFTVEKVFDPGVCRRLLRQGAIEQLLRRRLEHSGLFGALFRENAGRALLLPKGGFNRRMPLWLNRLRSKKLLGLVESYDDFPILLETWRTCLQDRFDLPSLRILLSEISSGAIRVSHCTTNTPSPFAADVVWRQTNLSMYLDDSRPGGSGSALSDDLLKEAARHASLRPEVPPEMAERLRRRLQRVEPGYAPDSGDELVEWLKDRIVIPADECRELHEAMTRDTEAGDDELIPQADRLCWIAPAGDHAWLLAAIEQLPLVRSLVPGFETGRLHDVEPTGWWDAPGESTGPSPELKELATRFIGDSGKDSGNDECNAGIAGDLDAHGVPDPPAALLQWLRFYGPLAVAGIPDLLGLPESSVDALVHELAEDGSLIVGALTTGSRATEICDAENMEHLLALLRRSRRPVFEQVDATRLVPLWARRTGIAMQRGRGAPGNELAPRDDPDHLIDSLEALFGYPAPASLWESDLLPTRVPSYYPLWLDGLLKESGLIWLGAGNRRLTFALADDLHLFRDSPWARDDVTDGSTGGTAPKGEADEELLSALHEAPDGEFWTLRSIVGISSEELASRLWVAAWSGVISNDSYETVRRGIQSHFKPEKSLGTRTQQSQWPGKRRRPVSRGSWAVSRPLSGRWYALPGAEPETPPSDPIEELEREKERARILLARYGVVFRELADRESASMQWRGIFRALRMMELSGEVVAGSFVRGIKGIQFATSEVLASLSAAADSGGIIWMNALDPASPCGTPLAAGYPELPSRIQSNHLVFRDGTLVMVSRRNGRELLFLVQADDPDLPVFLAPLRSMVSRRWNPRNRVVVERINGIAALDSPFAESLIEAGFRRDIQKLVLSAGYR